MDQGLVIDDIVALSRAIIRREAWRRDDLDRAFGSLARRSRLTRSFWWAMKYRPPKDLSLTKTFALFEFAAQEAWLRESYEDGRRDLEPQSALSKALLRIADSVVSEDGRGGSRVARRVCSIFTGRAS